MTPLEDRALSARLRSPEAMDGLEAVILSELPRFRALQQRRLDFGRRIGRADVAPLFDAVALEVADFLGVAASDNRPRVVIPWPWFSLPRFPWERPNATYDPRTQRIRIEQGEPLAIFRNTLAHEYDHHLLVTACGVNPATCGAFIEGHAIGVTHVLAGRTLDTDDGPASLYENLCRRLTHLLQAYRWIGDRLGRPVEAFLHDLRAGLARPHRHDDGRPVRHLTRCLRHAVAVRHDATMLSPHSLGTAVMAVAEAAHGEAIYRWAAQGHYTFLL